MTWLKLIANAVWTGFYGAILVAFLLFFLNDELVYSGLLSRQFAFILVWAALVYTPVFALLFPTLYVCLRFFATRRLRIPWLSLKTIVWLGIATLLTMTIVYYRNLRLFGALLSPGARDALRILCTTMAACWLLAVTGAALAQRRPQGRRTAHRVVAGLLILAPPGVMTLMAPLMTPTTARRSTLNPATPSISPLPAEPPDSYAPPVPEPKLLFIGLDAATMDFVLPLVSARQLPTFERLIKEGASARLDSFRPCSSRATWTAVMTGMPPWITGVRGRRTSMLRPAARAATPFGIVPSTLGMPILAGLGLLSSEPPMASEGRRPTLREILDALSIPALVVGWPDSFPDERLPETISPGDSRVSYRLEKILEPAPDKASAAHTALETLLRQSIATDLSARDAATGGGGKRLLAVRLPGLARVSRAVLRYHLPEEYGDVSPEEVADFGPILTRYYEFLDEMMGELIGGLGSDGTPLHVMVISAYGIAPSSGWERFIAAVLPSLQRQGTAPPPSGTWSEGPDGILLVHGPGVLPGIRLEDAGLLDVLPTALYLLGSPISDDLKGQLLRRLFERDYLESHPVQIVRGFGVPRFAF